MELIHSTYTKTFCRSSSEIAVADRDQKHHFSAHIFTHKLNVPFISQRQFCLPNTARPRDTRILVPEKDRAAQNRASEVYTYVLNEICFQKSVYLQGFCSKSVFHEVTFMY